MQILQRVNLCLLCNQSGDGSPLRKVILDLILGDYALVDSTFGDHWRESALQSPDF
jgi:hypothetical protein